jgi:hypothetical protein
LIWRILLLAHFTEHRHFEGSASMTTARDPFRLTDQLEPAALEVMATRLEARGRQPSFAQPLADYLERMAIDRAAEVLPGSRSCWSSASAANFLVPASTTPTSRASWRREAPPQTERGPDCSDPRPCPD